MNDEDRAALLADHQAIIDAEEAVQAALVARNTRMRRYKAEYGRGIVAEMAGLLGMNRVSVSDLVNDGAGTGRRRSTR
ncbi:MAG: hypothetical protein H0X35_11585 [Pseudonocardiales bacterium]|nr:hypothetical protein [Pseudonocardiales bacterium]